MCVVGSSGYLMTACHGHPKAVRKGKYVYTHILIAEKALGHYLPEKAVVHHVDGDITNNVSSNLVICQDQSYHRMLHVNFQALRACGHPTYRQCKYCKAWDHTDNLTLNKANRSRQHKHCHAKHVASVRASKKGN